MKIRVNSISGSDEELANSVHEHSLSKDPMVAATARLAKGTHSALIAKIMKEMRDNGPEVSTSAAVGFITSILFSYAATACKGHPQHTRELVETMLYNLNVAAEHSMPTIVSKLELAWESSDEKNMYEEFEQSFSS